MTEPVLGFSYALESASINEERGVRIMNEQTEESLSDLISAISTHLPKEEMPNREAAVAHLCRQLNDTIDPSLAQTMGVKVEWRPCSACPLDAISAYMKKGEGEWREKPCIMLVWDSTFHYVVAMQTTPAAASFNPKLPICV